jgi:NAD(P)-dependent dehydrogenase (short-subunit alcohol dehydrogenase family)
MATEVPKELIDAWLPLIPMHRMASPEELMTAVLYLASSASSYTSGSDVVVDGVYTCP